MRSMADRTVAARGRSCELAEQHRDISGHQRRILDALFCSSSVKKTFPTGFVQEKLSVRIVPVAIRAHPAKMEAPRNPMSIRSFSIRSIDFQRNTGSFAYQSWVIRVKEGELIEGLLLPNQTSQFVSGA